MIKINITKLVLIKYTPGFLYITNNTPESLKTLQFLHNKSQNKNDMFHGIQINDMFHVNCMICFTYCLKAKNKTSDIFSVTSICFRS